MNPQELQADLLHKIPLVHHLGMRVLTCSTDEVSISAELTKNRNHRFVAFGGSINTVLTLAAWGWLANYLKVTYPEQTFETVIQENHTRYLKPVKEDLVAICVSPETAELDKFQLTLSKKNISRLQVSAKIFGAVSDSKSDGTFEATAELAEFIGQFVAYKI